MSWAWLKKTENKFDKFLGTISASFKRFVRSVYFKYFLCLLAIYLIALTPLILANFRYSDDIVRMNYGQTNRGFDSGRYLSTVLSWLLYDGNQDLPDIAPLSQILAAALMAMTATILIRLLTDSKKFNFWYVLAAAPVGVFPYFLQCYSYRFDSVYMAFSVFVSVLPFLFYKVGRKNIGFIVAGILSQLAMCMTYQASSGIFPSVAIVLTLIMIHKKVSWKEILKFVGFSVLAYMVGLLIFKIFLMKSVIYEGYLDTNLIESDVFFQGVWDNYKLYVNVMKTDFKNIWFVFAGILAGCFVISNVLNTKRNKLLEVLFSFVALALLAMFAFGIYPVFKKPLFEPRAMYGVGIDLALIGLLAVNYKRAYIPKIAVLCLSYSFFIAALVYGNAIRAQKDYAEFRLGQTVSDLSSLGEEGPLKVQIRGGIGYDNTAKRAIRAYPFIGRTLHETYGGRWTWDTHYLFEVYSMPLFVTEDDDPSFDGDMKEIISNELETIYKKGNRVVIFLRTAETSEEGE